MKRIMLSLAFFATLATGFAQGDKYSAAMQSKLALIDSAKHPLPCKACLTGL